MTQTKPETSETDTEESRPNADAGLTDVLHGDSPSPEPVAGTFHVANGHNNGQKTKIVIHEGTDVICRNGEKIGEVVEIAGDHLVVEQGFFCPRDIYIPREVVCANCEADGVQLVLTREEFDARDWSREPDDIETAR